MLFVPPWYQTSVQFSCIPIVHKVRVLDTNGKGERHRRDVRWNGRDTETCITQNQRSGDTRDDKVAEQVVEHPHFVVDGGRHGGGDP